MNLRRTCVIALREGRNLFATPGGFVIVGIFWAITGLRMGDLLLGYRQAQLSLAQTPGVQTHAMGLHVNDLVVQPYLLWLGILLAFFVPLLTMKSVAEERRNGSLELLLSQPLRGGELVLGKFLGSVLALVMCLSILLLHALVLLLLSKPDWGAAGAGLAGLLLLGILFTAVGVLLSVLSRSQVEAAVLTLGVLLVLFLLPDPSGTSAGLWGALVRFFSVEARFADFCGGVLDLSHLAFFGGFTFLILALAVRCLDLIRWQG